MAHFFLCVHDKTIMGFKVIFRVFLLLKVSIRFLDINEIFHPSLDQITRFSTTLLFTQTDFVQRFLIIVFYSASFDNFKTNIGRLITVVPPNSRKTFFPVTN